MGRPAGLTVTRRHGPHAKQAQAALSASAHGWGQAHQGLAGGHQTSDKLMIFRHPANRFEGTRPLSG